MVQINNLQRHLKIFEMLDQLFGLKYVIIAIVNLFLYVCKKKNESEHVPALYTDKNYIYKIT